MKSLMSSLGFRLLIIAFLTLILLIPAFLMQGLISEREHRRDEVAGEISRKWGGAQTIVGPVISVPYTYAYKSGDTIEQTTRYAHLLPEDLNIEGTITPEVRYRGIYKVIVYNSTLSISGAFSSLNPDDFNIPAADFRFEDAFVSVGISDMTGIKEFVEISWDGREYVANPGIESNDVAASGISIAPGVEPGAGHSFAFDLNLNGSSGLQFLPVGRQTHVELSSPWPNPSFTGNFLPDSRKITSSGFTSAWSVLHLNRNFPQQWVGSNKEVAASAFGVDLLLPVDEYQKTMRTAKYAIMFIALTFLTFFMIELLSKKIIHPIQYLLVGFALLIFYALLLSISEYVVFGLAYLVASAATISMITIYSYSVLSDGRKTGIICGVLIILYGYLYILLQLQDFALLMGSIGLFVVLGLMMYLTRNINWFEIMARSSNAPQLQDQPKGGAYL